MTELTDVTTLTVQRRELTQDEEFGEWGKTDTHVKGLYIVKAGPAVKVGVTTNISARLRVLNTNCPYKIRLYTFVPFWGEYEEAVLHSWLDSERIKGEWFAFSEHTKETINNVKNTVRTIHKGEEFPHIYYGNILQFLQAGTYA